jgi:hypothetical protein
MSGDNAATLDELFAYYTGEAGEAPAAYRDTSNARQTATRIG